MKLSIIIPVYNEEKTVRVLLGKVLRAKLPNNIEKEIIVVDDGSTDKTKKVLSEFPIPNSQFLILRHNRNQGKGVAIRTGLKYVSGDYVIIQDADLEYDPNYYPLLLKPILEDNANVVYGTRLVNYPLRLWGKDKTVLPLHLAANRFLTWIVNFLYGSNLTDVETGYKLFTNEVLKRIDLKSNRFEIEPEITIKSLKLGYNIFEVPITTMPRGYDQGKKIGFADGLKAIWTIFWYKLFK